MERIIREQLLYNFQFIKTTIDRRMLIITNVFIHSTERRNRINSPYSTLRGCDFQMF